MSDAVVNGWTPIIHGQAISTVCESYSVDEYGNLSSRFVTQFNIWEVVQVGEGGEILTEGETIDLVWGRYNASPFAEPGGCETPRWSIVPQQVDIVALWIDEGVPYVDAWFEGDAGYKTAGGEGELPPCGEDLQREVIRDRKHQPLLNSTRPNPARAIRRPAALRQRAKPRKSPRRGSVAHELQRVADHVDDAGLHDRSREDGLDGLRKALEPVDTGDEDVVHPTILQLRDDVEPNFAPSVPAMYRPRTSLTKRC